MITAVFHQFHEVVAGHNAGRNDIHETHFKLKKKTGFLSKKHFFEKQLLETK